MMSIYFTWFPFWRIRRNQYITLIGLYYKNWEGLWRLSDWTVIQNCSKMKFLTKNMNQEQIEKFRVLLTKERASIIQKANKTLTEENSLDVADMPDEIDQASRESEQTAMLRLADKERKLLTQIERAIRKLDSGDYGICEGTGDPIGRKRLRARPWTRHSIHYKELVERQQRG